MFVHVVKPGESLFSIAELYGGTAERVRAANDLNGDRLIPGMSLIIPAGPRTTLRAYRIEEGDTLPKLARVTGVPPQILKASNEHLDEQRLAAGETLWVPVPQRSDTTIEVNAFMIPSGNGEDEQILDDTGDCLTYVSVFHSRLNQDGTIAEVPDERVLMRSKEWQITPLLTVTNYDGEGFSRDLARSIISDPQLRRNTIANLMNCVEAKGYGGVNLDFENIYPEDRQMYNAFVRELAETGRDRGIQVTVTVGPKMSDDPENPWMGAFDYRELGNLADRVVLMTIEWGWAGGPPMAIAPLNMVRRVLEYATSVIPPEKIMMGMALYGYNWPMPYVEGNRATGISPKAAVEQAIRTNGHIHFHAESASPMYCYRDSRNEMRQVWFEDGRSVLAKFHLVVEMGLRGVSYWVLGQPFKQNWILLSETFRIRKLE